LARSKNLGDVLHYFIPEDEQSAALSRSRERAAEGRQPEPGAGPAPRICVPAAPERLLWCALALELAGALAAERGLARVLAGFDASPLLPDVPGVRLDARERATADLANALAEVPPEEPALALERPERISALLTGPQHARFDAVLLPVDGAAWGVARALRLLRELAPALTGTRVLTWVVGADSRSDAAALGERLASAARRQHGLDVEVAPALPRDPALFRALLRGESVHASDDGTSAGARELRALSRQLGARRAA
jgi:hypothetical protein